MKKAARRIGARLFAWNGECGGGNSAQSENFAQTVGATIGRPLLPPYGRATNGRPLRNSGSCVHTVMRGLTPAAIKPSPLGRGVRDALRLAEFSRWENILSRMRACRQLAQHCAMLCFAYSLISRLRRQLPPREAYDFFTSPQAFSADTALYRSPRLRRLPRACLRRRFCRRPRRPRGRGR